MVSQEFASGIANNMPIEFEDTVRPDLTPASMVLAERVCPSSAPSSAPSNKFTNVFALSGSDVKQRSKQSSLVYRFLVLI